ncbi:hypothetical protein LOD99_4592 [Oopsacas minuta]|uniref:Ig-like domain-containing protein n=1 Tax=Oopsacas minuta TaxID=111878 RepID=A0AAV7JTG7_9METZ|nr:hypothetical protein LOD99_4592 [Oopsacas minuta]
MQIVQTQECTDIKLPNNIVVKRGSRAVLECSAQILIWTKNEKTINTGSENDCSCVIGNCGDLVFSSITDQDAGPSNAYRCRIYNQTSEISETAYICIEAIVEKIKYIDIIIEINPFLKGNLNVSYWNDNSITL